MDIIQTIIDGMQLQERQKRIDTWLSAADPSTNQRKAQESRQEGSGQWFLKGTWFSAWRAQPASFLWLNGIPGCGKTVLSSTIIDHLRQEAADSGNSYILLYFYFDFTDIRKQSLEDAIRSLISQLFYKRPQSQKHLDRLWSTCEDGRQQPHNEALLNTFEKMLQDSEEIWLVLDALDECKIRDGPPLPGLLGWLENLHFYQQNVRLLVTSRPEADIRMAIDNFVKVDCKLYLESSLIADDIYKFINNRVTSHNNFSRWRQRPEVQTEIIDTLQAKSIGMYDYSFYLFNM